MIPGGLQAFSVYAQFACLVMFEQVEGDAVKDGVVLGSVSGAFAAEVLAEADVQYPVKLVFDAPVLADDRVQPRRVGLEAGDVVAGFVFAGAGRLVITLGLDAHQPPQRRPFRRPIQQAQITEHRAGAALHAAMTAVDLLDQRVGGQHLEPPVHSRLSSRRSARRSRAGSPWHR